MSAMQSLIIMIAVSIVICLSRLDVLEAFDLPHYRPCSSISIGRILSSSSTQNLVRRTKIPVHNAHSFSGRGGKSSSPNQGSNQSKRSKSMKIKESTSATNRKRNTRSGGMGSSSRDAYSVHETNNNLNGIDLPNTKRSTPPWQVLHPTDRARNAAALKARREILAQGLPDPGLPYTSSLCNDKNNNNNRLKRQIRFASEADRKFLLWKRFSWKDPLSGMALIGSFLDKTLPPRLGVPEVAFLGRSNVGKSSLLNKLVSTLSSSFHTTSSSNSIDTKMDWARVSKTPGATASLNMYALLGKKMATTTSPILLGFADLPGFGYAKLSKDIKENIEITAEQYLEKRKELALAILLVDARRVPSEEDRTVLEALYQSGKPICVVATKADKIVSRPSTSMISTSGSTSGSHRMLSDNLQAIQDVLGLPEGQPLTVSSVTGLGIKDLWEIILEACEAHVAECKAKLENGNNYNNEDDDDTWNDEEQNIIDEDNNLVYSQGYEWNSNELHDRIDFDDETENVWNTDTVNDSMDSNVAKVQQGSNLKSLKKLAREKLRRGDV